MDCVTLIEENLNPPNITTDYHLQPTIQRGKNYYKELSEAPAKVSPECLVLPKRPPGRAA